MKHSLLFAAAFAGSISVATAQVAEVATATAPAVAPDSTHQKCFAVGVVGGGTYTRYQGSNAKAHSPKYRTGFHGGLTADVRLSNELTFHPEALYTRKGSDFANDALNEELSYVDVPLLMRYYPNGAFQTNTLFLEAGPQVSYLLTAKGTNDADIKDKFNKVTVDFVLGLGYRLANGLALGLRYDIGVSNIYREQSPATSLGRGDYQSNAKTDAFLLSIGYSFAGKR
jgi:hypothetical protein